MIRPATREDIPFLTSLARELLPDKPIPMFHYATTPGYFCVLDEGGAYLFAHIDVWNGERVAMIISAAARKDVSEKSRTDIYNWLCEWSRVSGIMKLLALTSTPEVFLKHWGFKLESFVISKDVPGRQEAPDTREVV